MKGSSDVRTVSHEETLYDPNPVRLASQIEPLDPFLDPFEDRRPIQPESSGNEVPVLQPVQNEPTDDPSGLGPPPVEDAHEIPQPPRTESPTPQPTLPNAYDERACDEEQEACRSFRERALSDSIRGISLDITPRYTLDIRGPGSEAGPAEREMRLSQVPSRVWRNREGAVVAEGVMTDFQLGYITIRSEDGEAARIRFSDLGDDEMCFVTAFWRIPTECVLGDEQFVPRTWVASTFTWKASALCHKPLYFEEVQLERYGHTAGPLSQPVVSGAHFFLNLATLPYQMGISPATECEYALGYYRPGNCAPWLVPPVPLSVKAALMEAGAIAGGVYVIP